MNRKFRCGRLTLTGNGLIKKVELESGGGTRICTWDSRDMNFDDVHSHVRNIFKIDNAECRTSLYDFQRHPLDTNLYNTFSDYINQNGLDCKSTVLYLCTYQVESNQDSTNVSNKRKRSLSVERSPLHTSTNIQQPKPLQSLSTVSVKSECVDHAQEGSNQTKFYSSLLEYSFEKESNDLVNALRQFIGQVGLNEILAELFEYSCIIYGYAHAVVDPLKQQIFYSNKHLPSMNESEVKLYSNSLSNIMNMCECMDASMNLCKSQYNHVPQLLLLAGSFSQFYENIKVQYNVWFEYIENINNRSSSSTVHRQSVPVISHPNELLSLNDCDDTKLENINEQIVTFTSSHNEETTIIGRSLSNNFKCKLIGALYQLSKRLHILLELLRDEKLSTYNETVTKVIFEIQSLETNIKSHNNKSCTDLSDRLSSLRTEYKNKLDDCYIKRIQQNFSRQIANSHKLTMKAFKQVLKLLHRYDLNAPHTDELSTPTRSSKRKKTSSVYRFCKKRTRPNATPMRRRRVPQRIINRYQIDRTRSKRRSF